MSRLDLVADCGRCAALCCVATSFEASSDFAFDKPAGTPCPYITRDCQCAIHDERDARGFRGCTLYDCHGAGPSVTRAFANEGTNEARNSAFLTIRGAFESLFLLTGAADLCPPSEHALVADLRRAIANLEALVEGGGRGISEDDVEAQCAHARSLILRVGVAIGGRRGLRVVR